MGMNDSTGKTISEPPGSPQIKYHQSREMGFLVNVGDATDKSKRPQSVTETSRGSQLRISQSLGVHSALSLYTTDSQITDLASGKTIGESFSSLDSSSKNYLPPIAQHHLVTRSRSSSKPRQHRFSSPCEFPCTSVQQPATSRPVGVSGSAPLTREDFQTPPKNLARTGVMSFQSSSLALNPIEKGTKSKTVDRNIVHREVRRCYSLPACADKTFIQTFDVAKQQQTELTEEHLAQKNQFEESEDGVREANRCLEWVIEQNFHS